VKHFLAGVIFAGVLCASELHSIQRSRPAEYDVKAAFLYNFGKFVRWPASRNRPDFRICVLGQDPFGDALDSIIAGEKVDGRAVAARRLTASADLPGCHIVFISQSEEKRLKDVLEVVGKTGALTVSEIPQFTQRGGMIGFVLADGRVRFEVNLAPADEAGLMFSSELLRVATTVKRNPGA
jgi:hypothetical protein